MGTLSNPSPTFTLDQKEVYLTAGVAASKGDCQSINLATVSSGEHTTTKQVVTQDLAYGIFVWAAEDIAVGDTGRYILQGKAKVLLDDTLAVGVTCCATNVSAKMDVVLANEKALAILTEGGDDGDVVGAIVDGLHGFGFNET